MDLVPGLHGPPRQVVCHVSGLPRGDSLYSSLDFYILCTLEAIYTILQAPIFRDTRKQLQEGSQWKCFIYPSILLHMPNMDVHLVTVCHQYQYLLLLGTMPVLYLMYSSIV